MYRMSLVVLVAVLVVCVAAPAGWSEEHKSVGRAELYSWIIPGAGQLYVGDQGRAAGFFLGWLAAAAIDDSGVVPLSINIWAGFDAGKTANKHNNKLPNRGLAALPLLDLKRQEVGLALVTTW